MRPSRKFYGSRQMTEQGNPLGFMSYSNSFAEHALLPTLCIILLLLGGSVFTIYLARFFGRILPEDPINELYENPGPSPPQKEARGYLYKRPGSNLLRLKEYITPPDFAYQYQFSENYSQR